MLRLSLHRLPATVAAAVLASLFPWDLATAQVPAASVSPLPSAAVVPVAPQTDAEIIRNGQGSLVFVVGTHGEGSGFICTMGNGHFLFTNAHVLAGNIPVTLTLLDGSSIRVGAAASAVGHDMVRFAVAPAQPAFNLLEHVNDALLVGDEVLVLGNAQGARVINPIAGKVVGIGPNLVEVDAPFQPGNSGSPIIQKKTGRVVGIATYVTEEHDDRDPSPEQQKHKGKKKSGEPPAQRKLRRFGYRLDSVRDWQDIAWPEFQAEAAAIKGVDDRTADVLWLVQDVSDHKGFVRQGQGHTPPVERIIQSFGDAVGGHPSPTDVLKAKQNLLDGLRLVCQSDVGELRPRLRYDYFVRELTERQHYRDGLSRMFDDALRAQSNETRR